MSEEGVRRLLEQGVLRRVEPDPDAAQRELDAARQHLRTAERISDDPTMAFGVAYEAARKAIRAHMRAKGLRVPGSEGAHARTGEYGVAVFDESPLASHFRAFDDMRKLRNRSQYDAFMVEGGDVEFALEHAQAIVGAVERDLE